MPKKLAFFCIILAIIWEGIKRIMAKRGSDTNTVTIKEIASMCGVSISTVSNVLNEKTNKVSSDVYQKVMDAVEKTGYHPNYLAKNLRAISTQTIGVIAEDLIIFSASSIIEGLMNACEEKGYNVVIENMRLFGRWGGNWLTDEALFQSALQPALTKMDSMNVDGIIYIGGHEHLVKNLVSANHLPIVMTYAYSDNPRIPAFRLDDQTGGYEVIKYLLGKEHTRIGIITGESDNIHTINRMIGVQKAYFESGLLFNPELVSYQHWNKQGGYDGMKELINKNITSVFCFSDAIASGAYAFLQEVGLKPGTDISVMGYDNQDISSYLTPQTTTMALPLEDIGYHAVSRLIRMCEKTTEEADLEFDVRLKPSLIERESVKT